LGLSSCFFSVGAVEALALVVRVMVAVVVVYLQHRLTLLQASTTPQFFQTSMTLH
jgi:hypothetical protein